MNEPLRTLLGLTSGQEASAEQMEAVLRGKFSSLEGFRGFGQDLELGESTPLPGRPRVEWEMQGDSGRSLIVSCGAVSGPAERPYGRIWLFQNRPASQAVSAARREEPRIEIPGRIMHDFNNVLAGMMGSLSLLETSVVRDKEACEELKTAQSAARRAAELAHQLLGGGQKRSQAAPEVDLKRGAGETILVVDDEFLIRNVNERLLRAIGYRTLSAVDGLDGLDLYRRHAEEIDLVLLDLTMPNLSGAEVFRQLREWNPDLPIIIYTGYVVDPNGFARENGSVPSAIVTKPLVIDALAAKIRQILDGAGAATSGLCVAA
jgi:CheY-like chemotaxis protein